MPFCSECGKNVKPNAKFCRNCGASQEVESPEDALPVVPPAIPSPADTIPVTEPVASFCSSCGGPSAPGETLCSRCSSEEPEPVSPGPGSEPAIEPGPAGVLPIPAPECSPSPACSSCSSPLAEDERFCGVCGAPASSAEPPAGPVHPVTVPVPPPPPVFIPPPPSSVPPPPAPPVAQARERLCRSCGNPISPGAKFCGKCCAKVVDAVPACEQPRSASPVPPVSPPLQPSVAPASAGTVARLCRSCGNVIKPGDKFCGRCCAKVAGEPPATSAPAEIPLPSPPFPLPPAPEPAPAGTEGNRSCRSCGHPIKPGDKFCGKCCTKVTGEVSLPKAPTPSPVPGAAQAPSCKSCGSPIAGPEVFCGICGASLVKEVPVPEPPAGGVCGSCGEPLAGATKFCGGCGAPVPAPLSAAPRVLATPPSGPVGDEKVLGVIGNAKKMKMLGASWDTYNIIITDQRMILARMTPAMINNAIVEAQTKPNEEEKALLSQMMHQMSAMFRFSQQYVSMPPDQALAETPGNRGIGNRSISAIRLKIQNSGVGGAEYNEFRMVIESKDGKFEFMIAEDDRFTTLLKAVYGDKVNMPAGYTSRAGVRIKLF